jgi:protein-disulfide isomerase
MRISLLKTCQAAALMGTLAVGPAMAQSAAFSEQQRQAIGEIVKDYLLKNPEVLTEVIAELEKRQAEAQRVAQAGALKETRQTLLNAPHSFVVGNPSGDVTLVEFFDYNCGYCKQALADMRALLKADPNLRVVLKDFPVLGPDSVEASRVALAAGKQLQGERLFDYHVKLMDNRGRVNGERALSVAKDLGLDMARLQKDMQGHGRPGGAPGEHGPRRQAQPLRNPGLHHRRPGHSRGGRARPAETGGRQRAPVRQGILQLEHVAKKWIPVLRTRTCVTNNLEHAF